MSWLVGLAADRRDWVRRIQVNTERKRRVLLVGFVGRYLLRKPPPWLDEETLREPVLELPALLAEAV